jgi:RNA polymerase sigma factor (sigma-70 family)
MVDFGSDAAVFRRSSADPAAFHLIVDRYLPQIHRYLHRRVGQLLADELSAEAFALAFERRATCRLSDGSALPWLYGIASRLLGRHWREETRRLRAYARTGVDPGFSHDEWTIEERLDADREGARLAVGIAALPRKQREALWLYAVAELSYEEIAVALDVPIGTVRTWLHRARETVRPYLSARGPAPIPFTRGVDTDG